MFVSSVGEFIHGGDTVALKPCFKFLTIEKAKLAHWFVVWDLTPHHELVNVRHGHTHISGGFLAVEDFFGGVADVGRYKVG